MNRIIELSELNKSEKDMPTLLYNLNKKMLYTRFGHIFKNIWDIHTLDQRYNNPIIDINDLCINYIQHDDIIKSLRMDPGDKYGK